MTAPEGANVNNLDAMSVTTASHATQLGGMTSLDAYLASTNLVDTAQVMGDAAAGAGGTISSSPPTAGPTPSPAAATTTTAVDPPETGVEPEPEGPPTPSATCSRATPQRADTESTPPTATGATTTVRQVAGQFDTVVQRHVAYHRLAFKRQTPLGKPPPRHGAMRLVGRPGCGSTPRKCWRRLHLRKVPGGSRRPGLRANRSASPTCLRACSLWA